MKLKVTYKTTTTSDEYFGYGLHAEVVEAEGIDPNIFVFHAGMPEMPTKKVVDTFSHVASPVDMEEYPPEEPDLKNHKPFYRRSELNLWVRSSEWLGELKQRIDADVGLLVKGYSLLNDENQYNTEEVKTYG